MRLPLGAPGLVPPYIRHRFRPFTAGDWHSVPLRVSAKHRGAIASRSGYMGLFACFSIFSPPGVLVDLIGDNGLPTLIYVNVLRGLCR